MLKVCLIQPTFVKVIVVEFVVVVAVLLSILGVSMKCDRSFIGILTSFATPNCEKLLVNDARLDASA